VALGAGDGSPAKAQSPARSFSHCSQTLVVSAPPPRGAPDRGGRALCPPGETYTSLHRHLANEKARLCLRSLRGQVGSVRIGVGAERASQRYGCRQLGQGYFSAKKDRGQLFFYELQSGESAVACPLPTMHHRGGGRETGSMGPSSAQTSVDEAAGHVTSRGFPAPPSTLALASDGRHERQRRQGARETFPHQGGSREDHPRELPWRADYCGACATGAGSCLCRRSSLPRNSMAPMSQGPSRRRPS